ncbi:hypothetical protein NCS56_01353600 [Fusarium sp. Ph1]|nr:hypothetical protein NCS56_01353600 [Fusarium sp. Ph1]
MSVIYWKPIWVILCIMSSLTISALITWLSREKRFSDIHHVNLIKQYRAYISIIVQVLSTVLSIGQTYVLGSLVAFSTNAQLASSHKLPTLDKLKLRQAMVSKSPIWEWQTKKMSLISILWLLGMQIPAALWAGSITPILTKARHEALIPIPDYSESTAKYWSTICPPATSCDQLLGSISDRGTFSYVAWKTRTGLLLNAVSQASSRDSSTPQHQKLDATGFTYHGRSYGVGAAVGLVQPQLINDISGTIQNYSFYEHGYKCEVSCQYNKSSQLSWIKSDLVTTPGGIYAPQGFWVNGDLPNGVWNGFPTWAVLTEDFATALAAVNSQSRYMYGFLAGKAYMALNQTQCEAKFSPTRFKVDVDVSAKNISVVPAGKGLDIDPSRALVNISFQGVGYLSQTLTTLYTSVLGDSFLRNIDNVRARNNRTETVDQDVLNAVEEGLEVLIDNFLGSSGAAQVALL